MLIDFNSINDLCVEGMNGGKGLMFSKMYNDDNCRII